ncbi:MAG: MFS transporter [Planctomycetes bacterium]|nr:MFS transporter [Planctomycetota bacterium]
MGPPADNIKLAAPHGGRVQHRPLTWRGVSLPALALVLLGPFLAAVINLITLFWLTTVQGAHAGLLPWQLSMIATLSALAYGVSSFLAGKWTRPHRAVSMLIGSTIGVAALASVILLWPAPTLPVLAALGLINGLLFGQYFVPLQSRMGDVKPFQTVAWSVAAYNASWGGGDAFGPVVAITLMRFPITALIGAVWLVTTAHAALILIANRTPHGQPQVHMTVAASTPQQRRWGWAASFLVMAMYMGVVATLYPGLGVVRGWSDPQIGMGVAVMALPIPLTAPILPLLRRWFSGPWLLAGMLTVAAAALAILPHTQSWPASLACLGGMGVGFAGTVFHAIYYVNADTANPTRSIGINEALVGAGATLGPLALGLLAWNDFASPLPYHAWAGLLLLTAAVIVWDYCKQRRASAALPEITP